MPRIQQLPPLVVSKIAAGEVIERPASVLKELLENAVDAGARRLDVEIEQGGTELIRVVDDGCGIHTDDLPLAFASHATSKLQTADDLFRIGTLGFRGEALNSIGGVAQVTLQSRPPAQSCGAEVTCHGGELSAVRPWNGSPGTRLEVRHLFYNTPVRRKFLRTHATEFGHLSEMFTRIALAHARPDFSALPGTRSADGLHLTLKHNHKLVYEVPASLPLLDRIGVFFGHEVSQALYAIQARHGAATLTGYIADPACERGTAKMQYLFLNGRWIRDRSVSHALQEAFRGLLMTGRYAVAFLFLEVPPDQVDVNVHPTKAEVRFRESAAIHHLVFSTIRQRLHAENLTARLQVPSTINPTGEIVPKATLFDRPGEIRNPQPPSWPGQENVPRREKPAETFGQEPWHSSETVPQHGEAVAPPMQTVPSSPPSTALPALPMSQKVIQLYEAYLVLETDKGMLIIDQHALHERILFEQWKARLRSGPLETQRLLIPEPVDLSAEQAARVLEVREVLTELGLGVEDFGGDTVIVTSYPSLLGRRSPSAILMAVVDYLD